MSRLGYTRPGSWGFDADDFGVVDGLEEVVIEQQEADGTFGPPYYAEGVRELPTKGNVSGAVFTDLIWHVNAIGLPVEIRPGDRITDACAIPWTVSKADLAGVQDTWKCECIRSVGEPQ